MLFNYRTSYRAIERNVVNTIAECAKSRKGYRNPTYPIDASKRNTPYDNVTFKKYAQSYRQDFAHTSKPQNIKARFRAALVAMFPQSKFDHFQISAILRQMLKCARYVAIDKDNPDTHVAFSPDGVKAHDYKRRRSLTFGKFITRKCTGLFTGRLALTDSAIAAGAVAFNPPMNLADRLRIVTGADALAVYADDANGIASCMSGMNDDEDKSTYVAHHFLANPDKLRLVVLYDGATLALRAKLWFNDDKTYTLDRVYARKHDYTKYNIPSVDAARAVICEYLAQLPEIKVSCLTRQQYANVTLTHKIGEHMPYLDLYSCNFDRIDAKTIRIHENGDYCAQNTDGSDPSDDYQRVCCCSCRERIDEDDAIYTKSGDCYCEDCYSDQFTYDDYQECEIDASDAVYAHWTRTKGSYGSRRTYTTEGYTHSDNTVECTNGETWIRDDDNVIELYDGERYAFSDDAIQLYDSTYAIADDDIVEIVRNGETDTEYALREDCTQLYDDTWALSDEIIKLHSGMYALELQTILVNDERYLLNQTYDITDDYGNIVTLLIEAYTPAPNQLELCFAD